MRIAICQINSVVGAIEDNCAAMINWYLKAVAEGAELVVFPELAMTGYPPEDLVLRGDFKHLAQDALSKFASVTTDVVAVVGNVSAEGHNSAFVCSYGQITSRYDKQELPNYSVFDEQRTFIPGSGEPVVIEVSNTKIGLAICEDLWVDSGILKSYKNEGTSVIVSLNASPFYEGRLNERLQFMANICAENQMQLVYVNSIGGQDELVFDGGSFHMSSTGELLSLSSRFSEELAIVEVGRSQCINSPIRTRSTNRLEEIYSALVLGVSDYIKKNGFSRVLLGLSGGIDSALVATIACDAVGAKHVSALAMPSRFSSEASFLDAEKISNSLGFQLNVMSIEDVHDVAVASLLKLVETRGVTDENLQSRIRGLLLMAVSNSTGALVLSPGNKSESATGYSTLYGDTVGAISPIKDVYKTDVYALCKWRNEQAQIMGLPEPIPETVITKEPTAELRAGQKDSDSLPPYEVLDSVLRHYLEEQMSTDEITTVLARRFQLTESDSRQIASGVIRLVKASEYKRRQTPTGIRVSKMAFGRDRRYPITNSFVD